MGLAEWLDLHERAQGRIKILKTEGTNLFNDINKQLDNELTRVERGTTTITIITDGVLKELRARVDHRQKLLDKLLK